MRSALLLAGVVLLGCEGGHVVPPPPLVPAPVVEPLPALAAARVRTRADRASAITVHAREAHERQGPLATTTLAISVRNDGEEVDEATLALSLPAGAVVGRLSLDVEGRWMEGEVMPHAAARRFYEGIVRPQVGPRRDPALLIGLGGGEWTLDVFPVPAGGERRVELVYHRVVGGPPGTARVEAAPPSLDGGGVVFAVVPPFEAAPAGQPPAQVVIALDTSLSLGKAGFADALTLARRVLAVRPDARLVTGDVTAHRCAGAVETCLAAVEAAGAGGATDLDALLQAAYAAVDAAPAVVLLVTDGRHTAGDLASLTGRLRARVAQSGVAHHAVAVGRARRPVLRTLADAGRGRVADAIEALAATPLAPAYAVAGAERVEVIDTPAGTVLLGRLPAAVPRVEVVRDASPPRVHGLDELVERRATVELGPPAPGFATSRVLGDVLVSRAVDDAPRVARAWGIAGEHAAMLALETDADYATRGIARWKAVERALEQGLPPPVVDDAARAGDRALVDDGDGDTILDAIDQCPNEPETWNGLQDDDGCPDLARVRVLQQDLRILHHVYFVRGEVGILRRHDALLDEVANVMRDHPEIRLVAVEGHRDARERGGRALARRRAEAVRHALVQRGVEPERLIAVGYDDARPLTAGRTEVERARNRRVELNLLVRLDSDDPLLALTAAETAELVRLVAAGSAASAGARGDELLRALMTLPPSADPGEQARRHQLAGRWLATLADPDARWHAAPARLALSADLLAWLGRADEAARRRSELDEVARDP